uniref:Nucleoporin_N domain-containing protein n=1 Tax=Meloidogyne hapla TaxID=6305 RepID=A0A1I8BCB8_MELHA
MTDLKLFIDPYEAPYPSTVRELLNDTDKKKANICATVTSLGKCLLICNNHIYIWSFIKSESGIPHATRMELPTTGLKYTIQLVCLFKKSQSLKYLSLLAISPEGNLRYWSELGKQPRNEQCLLNNEVAHSIQQINSQENVHRFLLTTTTGSFHIIDLFHGLDQPDRLATRPLDVGGPGGGIGHRMSLLLFGSLTAEKERILKTIFVHGKMGPRSDVVNVLGRYLRFYSIFDQKALDHEVDIADLALIKFNKVFLFKNVYFTLFILKSCSRSERRHFSIVDAIQYSNGVLLLLVGEKKSNEISGRDYLVDRQLFVGYYEEVINKDTTSIQRILRSLIEIELPESLCAVGMDKRLQTAQLLSPSNDECCVAFYDSFVLIRHHTATSRVSFLVLESYTISNTKSPMRQYTGDTLFGSAAIHGSAHLVLKDGGVCTIQRLPSHYELNFWKKHQEILHQLDTQEKFTVTGCEHRLKDAFVEFCAKNIKQSKKLLRDMLNDMQNAESDTATASHQEKHYDGLSELAVDLLLYFLDRQPMAKEDERWGFVSDSLITNEQQKLLRELAETKKFTLLLRQLQIKLSFYKMFVLFLRTYKLIDMIEYPLQSFQMRSGKAVIAELGEKLVSMMATFRWLSEHSQSLPLVNRAMNELAKSYVIRFGLPKSNPYLSPTDYVYSKVSTFHELVSSVVQAGDQAMLDSLHSKAQIIIEVGSLLLTLVEGVQDARHEDFSIHIENDISTWLNQPDFLTHFTAHLNTALDFLTASIPASAVTTIDEQTQLPTPHSTIYEQCLQLAHFVLSQQSPAQRNDSKIISRFATLGHQRDAVELAEKYKDFTFLVVYCYNKLDKRQCEEALNRYKKEYENDSFYDFLYTWYQQKGMFNHLLAEPGKKASDFLAKRQELNWIRQVEEELSLCKLAALCEEEENLPEIAELSEQIRGLHEIQKGKEMNRGGNENGI